MDKETIKKLLDDGVITAGQAAQYFPELAESEDEKIRKMIINTLNRDKILTEDEAYDCVAWLEKQREQKFVEWSEEDRKMMRNIIDDIHCGTNFNPEVMHAANEREKWFKSICLRLQSRWKPSDGQMGSIKQAVSNMKNSACYDSELVHLLQDLKKLKEE